MHMTIKRAVVSSERYSRTDGGYLLWKREWQTNEKYSKNKYCSTSNFVKNNKSIKSVYSYKLFQYISISVSIDDKCINAYDYSRNCYVSGNYKTQNSYSLYDYETGQYYNFA